MDFDCNVNVIHINSNQFRIIIKRNEIEEEVEKFDKKLNKIRIDIEMNPIAFKKYVCIIDNNENFENIKNFYKSESYSEKKQLQDDIKKNRAFGFNGFTIKQSKLEDFESHIDDILKHFESFLRFREYDFHDSASNDQLFSVKFIDLKQHHYCIYHVFQTEICDSFRIIARNTFESFCIFFIKF